MRRKPIRGAYDFLLPFHSSYGHNIQSFSCTKTEEDYFRSFRGQIRLFSNSHFNAFHHDAPVLSSNVQHHL